MEIIYCHFFLIIRRWSDYCEGCTWIAVRDAGKESDIFVYHAPLHLSMAHCNRGRDCRRFTNYHFL